MKESSADEDCPSVDDETIQRFIDEIDRIPQEDEPRSRIVPGHPPGFVFVEANKGALIRLGRHFLAAAIAPEVTHANDVGGKPVNLMGDPLSQVLHPKNCVGIGWIRRVPSEKLTEESIDRDGRRIARSGFLSNLGCGLVVFFFLFLLVSGMILWMVVLFGDLR